MPQVIIQARSADGTLAAVTFAERTVPIKLRSDHYHAELIERVGWALIDAEALEAQSDRMRPDRPPRANTQARSRAVAPGTTLAKRQHGRPRRPAAGQVPR